MATSAVQGNVACTHTSHTLYCLYSQSITHNTYDGCHDVVNVTVWQTAWFGAVCQTDVACLYKLCILKLCSSMRGKRANTHLHWLAQLQNTMLCKDMLGSEILHVEFYILNYTYKIHAGVDVVSFHIVLSHRHAVLFEWFKQYSPLHTQAPVIPNIIKGIK